MATKIWGFCDLNVSNSFNVNNLDLFTSYGFHTIAINTHVEEPSEEPKKKKKKGESKEKKDYIPPPVDLPKYVTELTKLNILQRVTIEFSDSSISHKLNQSENLKKYDIVAVLPKTMQAFQYACGTLDIDIISFQPENRIPFKFSRKLYRQAAERGIYFELPCAPAIKDSTCRKNIISTAHTYHAVGKSKNIIVTSGAESEFHVSDVHDVINLGFILGLNSTESLQVVRDNPRKAILKAEGRKCGKLFVAVSSTNSTQDNKITFEP